MEVKKVEGVCYKHMQMSQPRPLITELIDYFRLDAHLRFKICDSAKNWTLFHPTPTPKSFLLSLQKEEILTERCSFSTWPSQRDIKPVHQT